MKTKTKIIWIYLGYLVFSAFLIERIVCFINGQINIVRLIIGVLLCCCNLYLLAHNHFRLLKENKEEQL